MAPRAASHRSIEALRPPHTTKPAICRALSLLMLGVPCAVGRREVRRLLLLVLGLNVLAAVLAGVVSDCMNGRFAWC